MRACRTCWTPCRRGRDLRTVPGISYRVNEKEYVHNPDRPMVDRYRHHPRPVAGARLE